MGWSRGISEKGREGLEELDGMGRGAPFSYMYYIERKSVCVCIYLWFSISMGWDGERWEREGLVTRVQPIPFTFLFFFFEKLVCWVQISSPLAMLLQKQFRQSMLYANQIKPDPTLHPLSPPIPSALQMELWLLSIEQLPTFGDFRTI